ncbi:MAG: type I pullulanase [Lachnospiraceae bacterium]|nr:type I pullulanase [Lachnospiraceae bacterium]
MKRRLKALLMAFVMMVTTVISLNGNFVKAMADEDGIKVVFHFTKEDNDYSDYRMWLWTIGDGFEVNMVDNGTEATYELNEVSSTLRIGYIVKRGEGWEAKDWDADRFVDLSTIVSGRVDVYIQSGVGAVTMDTSQAVTGIKMSSAQTSDLTTIDVQLSAKIDNPSTYFKVRSMEDGSYSTISGVEVVKEDATNSIFQYKITVADKLDIMSSYEVEYDAFTFMIGMPDLYVMEDFESQYTYTGNDLGATYTKDSTSFRVWAPVATDLKVNLYASGTEGTDDKLGSYAMTEDVNGTWVVTIDGDLNGVYYTYEGLVKGKVKETIDPYAVTAGVNGKRGMILDLDSTDPEGWAEDKNPCTSTEYTDDVIYELHIRDFSYEASSGVSEANRGKYLAFTETGTTNSYGQTTGIDYLKDLGVTHVHLLPTFDYASVDETRLNEDQFNWGYDPQNFNLPEGSYSTDPYNGEVRVKEFKQMVKSMHDAGISVVMDVVYGHVARSDDFSVNMLTPSYYSRTNSNGSGCGNDTATERLMNRKYIVDSMVYWAKEYHIDGFRIDQVGLFDTDTVVALTEALHAIDPTILLYGEGWSMTTNTSKEVKLATQGNADATPGFGYFNDGIRDAVKGGVFDDTEPGYVTRNYAKLGTLLENLKGLPMWIDGQFNPGQELVKPAQVINYNSCHDNYALFDKLALTNPDDSYEERVKQNNLATAILFTSQGVPFFQAGEEILRSKPLEGGGFEHNSYASPSSLNSIKWDDLNKAEVQQSVAYYKGLMELRANHAAFRMTSFNDIMDNFEYILEGDADEDSVIAYKLNGGVNGEVSDGIVVIFNPSKNTKSVDLPEGEWNICVNAEKAGTEVLGTATGKVDVEPISAMVLVKGATEDNKNVIVSQNDPNVTVEDANGVLTGTETFTSEKVSDAKKVEDIKNIVKKNNIAFDDIAIFELILKDAAGVEIHQLNGKVQVVMNVPFELKANETIKVFRADGDKMIECKSSISNGKIKFETDHFSTFVFVKQAALAPNEGPATGDNAMACALIVLMAFACVAAVVIVRKRKFN